jgi:hypothetical protein
MHQPAYLHIKLLAEFRPSKFLKKHNLIRWSHSCASNLKLKRKRKSEEKPDILHGAGHSIEVLITIGQANGQEG